MPNLSPDTLKALFVIVSHPEGEERLPLLKIIPLDDPHTTVAMATHPKDDPYRGAIQQAIKEVRATGKTMVVYVPVAVVEPEPRIDVNTFLIKETQKLGLTN